MNNLLNMINVFLEAAPNAATGDVNGGQMLISFIATLGLPILMIGLMYFMLIIPQRKEEKQRQADRDNLTVGDNIITVGGVVGRVVNIKDDEVTISTSVANTVLTFRKVAIDKVIKPISDED